jgi:hypothetical protein
MRVKLTLIVRTQRNISYYRGANVGIVLSVLPQQSVFDIQSVEYVFDSYCNSRPNTARHVVILISYKYHPL